MKDIYSNLYVTELYSFRSKMNGFILMNVNTLDVYTLDETENNIIKALKKHDGGKGLNSLDKCRAPDISSKIDKLLENGILRKKEAKNECNSKSLHFDNDNLSVINAIDIFISKDCNLACKYCFEKSGSYNSKSGLMEPDTGKKTIDFLIRRSGNKKDLFISFFGGEPLINFNVLKEIVHYALEEGKKNNKDFHFSLTTNGTLLSDPVIDFIQEHNIKVLISIDGDIKSQNFNRPYKGGRDSYEDIAGNLKKLSHRNILHSARATVTPFTKNSIADNYDHLISMGFKRIHFENALAPKGKFFITDKNDIKDIKKQYALISKRIADKIKSNQQYNLETIPLPLDKLVTKIPGFYSCTAGKGYVSVDVNGDIYLCHRLVGEERFYLGSVIDNTYNEKWSEIVRNEMSVENRKKCRKCWARYICGGGCYEINYNYNKDISLAPQIYCQLMKHSIKMALTIYSNAAE